MLAQLKTVVLIREAIKLVFLWASGVSGASAFVGSIILSKWPEKENFLLKLDSLFLFWEMKAIQCKKLPRNWRFPTTVCTTPFRIQHKRALTRIEREVGGPGAKLSKRTSTLQSLVWDGHLTGPQLATSLNGTRKTPVSTSTVKRRLREAGLLGRVAEKEKAPCHTLWTALDWSQFPPTTGQWPKAYLQTMQELFWEEAVSWYSVCNGVAKHSHQISTLLRCCGSSLTIWYVRSVHQANPTLGRCFRKRGVKFRQIISTNWQLECQRSARL